MIDKKNKIIIEELQRDGRATITEIAKKIGLTSMGAKKRVDKLIKEGLIKVKALVNVEKFEIKLALIAMELESGEVLRDMLNKFENCPRIIKFFVTTGAYNLFALVWAENYYTLESISLESCSLRAQKGVRRFEFYPIADIYYDTFMDIKVIAEKTEKIAPCGVYCGGCERYKRERCQGCPSTIFYKGRL
ncbi:Lrp/AsnC family transcriptional regulator [Archaeoglobus profundus]|uniref:Transcriptional regulator, AsnC family n=1 Tax=Archaeoglobus profundus (strain DSM 5631 / JCM 9629 / NBRC 100127 / Av18) TaxID=572546 RepID=D2RH42_ARCPA|nr:Lrp/AsnC family transcriptional regulator [Archaeoglobus profundus]ADB57617.1 transcriptional regulator, AsnC family [Archaeoglobus profundus DSM 5631]